MTEGNGHSDSNAEQFRYSIRLLHKGDYEQAAKLLEELYQQDPENAEYALNLGGAYILQRRHEDALEILERAAKLAPDNVNVWVNLAAARLGPLEESSEAQQNHAIQAYEKALSVNPEVPNVHYMLGLIYRSRNDKLRAVAHFTRALEQNPEDKDARRMLAAIASDVSGKRKDES